jgi:hypothetical protein
MTTEYLSTACTLSVPVLLAHTCTQVHWLSQPEPPASDWIRLETNVSTCIWQPSTSCHPAPSPSPCYPLTHSYRSIGYRNRNPQSLAESVSRLMHLRVFGFLNVWPDLQFPATWPTHTHTLLFFFFLFPLWQHEIIAFSPILSLWSVFII